MVDDDVRLADIDDAFLPRCVPLQAVLDHGDLSGGHKLRHDLAEVDPCVGVLADLVACGDRIDEIAIGFGGEPVPRHASLGPADVEVVHVPIAIHVGHGHGGTSIQRSGWNHSSVTRLTDFMSKRPVKCIFKISRGVRMMRPVTDLSPETAPCPSRPAKSIGPPSWPISAAPG